MQTDTVSIEQFIKDNRIAMTAERVDRNPNMDNADMDHWKVVFTRKFTGDALYTDRKTGESKPREHTATLTTYFSQGYGHNGAEPKPADVLGCLAWDASSVENTSFERWCDDIGLDTDSRKAERTYKACEHGARRLKAFLGDELYETLLWNTERQ